MRYIIKAIRWPLISFTGVSIVIAVLLTRYFMEPSAYGYLIGAIIASIPWAIITFGTIAIARGKYENYFTYQKAQQAIINGEGVRVDPEFYLKQYRMNAKGFVKDVSGGLFEINELRDLMREWNFAYERWDKFLFVVAAGEFVHPHIKIVAAVNINVPTQWHFQPKLLRQVCENEGKEIRFVPNASLFTLLSGLRKFVAFLDDTPTIQKNVTPHDVFLTAVSAVDRGYIDDLMDEHSPINFIDRHNFYHHREVFDESHPEYAKAPEEWVKSLL